MSIPDKILVGVIQEAMCRHVDLLLHDAVEKAVEEFRAALRTKAGEVAIRATEMVDVSVMQNRLIIEIRDERRGR